jgi:transposase
MISGEEDINELVSYRHGKMKASKEELSASLYGRVTDHHRFMLQLIKKSMLTKEALISELDDKILDHLKQNEILLDLELLQTIPGVGKDAAAGIIAEIGTDMSQFPNEQHLSSWAGMSPGNNESAGKKKVPESPMAIIT